MDSSSINGVTAPRQPAFINTKLGIPPAAPFVTAITHAVKGSLTGFMGGSRSKPAPVDFGPLIRAQEVAMAQRDAAFKQQLSDINQHHQEKLASMQNATAEERARMEEDFKREQAQFAAEMEAERIRYEGRISALAQSMQEAERRVAELAAELDKPIKNRQAKLNFVNSLNLAVHQNESLLLVGPKGTGKSTFMWLLNRGEEPVQSFSDGTVEILQLQGYVDSIGLRGWSPEELVKLLVLMIYDGIPKDLIIFGNDRIDLPVTSLGLLGINGPMIVIMSSDFWKNYAPPKGGGRQRIFLKEGQDGVKRVEPLDDLDMVYNLPVYKEIEEFGLGKPITHHDDIDTLVYNRTRAGVRPFKFLLAKLGDTFTVDMENDNTIETIFRFIYVYEKKYNKDRLKFMNSASLQDFATLA